MASPFGSNDLTLFFIQSVSNSNFASLLFPLCKFNVLHEIFFFFFEGKNAIETRAEKNPFELSMYWPGQTLFPFFAEPSWSHRMCSTYLSAHSQQCAVFGFAFGPNGFSISHRTWSSASNKLLGCNRKSSRGGALVGSIQLSAASIEANKLNGKCCVRWKDRPAMLTQYSLCLCVCGSERIASLQTGKKGSKCYIKI